MASNQHTMFALMVLLVVLPFAPASAAECTPSIEVRLPPKLTYIRVSGWVEPTVATRARFGLACMRWRAMCTAGRCG